MNIIYNITMYKKLAYIIIFIIFGSIFFYVQVNNKRINQKYTPVRLNNPEMSEQEIVEFIFQDEIGEKQKPE